MEKMILNCPICKENREQKDMELSHDIPRYLGGIDLDGRHWLCNIPERRCHDKYEFMILSKCCIVLFGEKIKPNADRRFYIDYMNALKISPQVKKAREIAEAIKKEVYGNETN
jgi:hypothetical protein